MLWFFFYGILAHIRTMASSLPGFRDDGVFNKWGCEFCAQLSTLKAGLSLVSTALKICVAWLSIAASVALESAGVCKLPCLAK
jgi:hypothetical protein